ncbi:SusC/RagA family TonB-linked outer membrane protein [Viscerimonas tarda]
MKNKLIKSIFLFFLLSAPAVFAQEIEVTGKIFDAATKQTLAGTRIEAYNNPMYSAMSNEQGDFTIKIPAFVNMLQVNAPGYNRILLPLQNQKQGIKVNMYSAVFKQDYPETIEITPVGKADDFRNSTALSIDDEIQAKLGKDVRSITRSGTPAMGAAMFIHGLNSLNANAQPLIVLDGVILDIQREQASLHDGFSNNILSGIDVNDIAKVTVLKNATAIYGAKAGNGVIVIETKRGRSLATRIDASLSGGFTAQPKMPSMMDASQFRVYATDLMPNTYSAPPYMNDNPNFIYYNRYHNNTNWKDQVYREAFTQNYSVGVQGGDAVAVYNLSLGYLTSESALKENDFNRFNTRFNTDITFGKKLTTKFDISYSQSTRNLRDDGATESSTSSSPASPGYLSLIKAPILNPHQFANEGSITRKLEDYDLFNLSNPLAILSNGVGEDEYSIFNVAITPQFKFTDDLLASTKFSYSLNRLDENYFRPMAGVVPSYLPGLGTSRNQVKSLFSRQNSIFSDTRIEWTKQLQAHNLKALGGFRYMTDSYASNYLSGHNTGNDKMVDIVSGLSFRTTGGYDDTWKSMSYYLYADYNYKGKYFLQGSASTETSSRFGKEIESGFKAFGMSWGVFPSIQAAWLISSESFFQPVSFVNSLKLSAGMDVSGNDDIDNYASKTYFTALKYMDRAIGLELANIKNPSIQWETTKRYNVGLEMSLFDNRIALEANLYKSETDNLLTLKQFNYVSGLENYWSNEGALENTGYEIALHAKVVNTQSFKWEVGASVAHYKNKITSLPDSKSYTTSISGAEILTRIGQPADVFYGYKTDGVFATAEEAARANLVQLSSTGSEQIFKAGDMRFVNTDNSDNIINEKDKVVIGDPNPDFYGNIYTKLAYNRFNLDVIFNYSQGNEVYNYLRSQLEAGSMLYNQTTALQNRWTNEGQHTAIPRAEYLDPTGNSRFSDRWIEDGSYIRLKNVTLSYNLPLTFTWLQGITVWASANNLLTLTKYLGSDPEFSIGNGVLYQGIDRGLLPQSRSMHLGVKINL